MVMKGDKRTGGIGPMWKPTFDQRFRVPLCETTGIGEERKKEREKISRNRCNGMILHRTR
jgi:hypothetical protein